jgi:gluconate 5-dehydrogenase
MSSISVLATSANVMASFRLDGRCALITGSSSGIGFALARALGQAGAKLVLNGRNAEKLEASANQLRSEGLDVTSSIFDVTRSEDVQQAINALEASGNVIDILVNNAGMQIRNPLHEFQDADWHTLMRTNLDSVFYVSKAVATKMIPRRYARSSISAPCRAS